MHIVSCCITPFPSTPHLIAITLGRHESRDDILVTHAAMSQGQIAVAQWVPLSVGTTPLGSHRQCNVYVIFNVGLTAPLNLHGAHTVNKRINAGFFGTQGLPCCITCDLPEGITVPLPSWVQVYTACGEAKRTHIGGNTWSGFKRTNKGLLGRVCDVETFIFVSFNLQ